MNRLNLGSFRFSRICLISTCFSFLFWVKNYCCCSGYYYILGTNSGSLSWMGEHKRRTEEGKKRVITNRTVFRESVSVQTMTLGIHLDLGNHHHVWASCPRVKVSEKIGTPDTAQQAFINQALPQILMHVIAPSGYSLQAVITHRLAVVWS